MLLPVLIKAPRQPLVYEINTRSWLREIGEQLRKPVTLADVPGDYFRHWMRLGVTHIWLMGVWHTAPASIAFNRNDLNFRQNWSRILPGLSDEEITGSPYAIAGYNVCPSLGDEAALQKFRAQLHRCNLKLILDFITNHTGLDHPRVRAHPACYVQHTQPQPGAFAVNTDVGVRWIAHGKDPYFPAWADTAQLDLRNPDTRRVLLQDLQSVSKRCDGVRCDMAMLVLREVFERNWPPPADGAWEFWPEAIAAVKQQHPEFLFLAEAYWDLEQDLLDLGFDYAYDKQVYDLLITRRYGELQDLLCSRSPEFLKRACHFLENHDEPRIASLLCPAEHRAAAMLTLALPGMRLLHEGQLTGAKIHASVHLNRRPHERVDVEVAHFYSAVLKSARELSAGAHLLRPAAAWPENPTARNIIVVQSEPDVMHSFDLLAVNLAPHPGQCRVRPIMIEHPAWYVRSVFGVESSTRSGREILADGFFLDLPAHSVQAFRFTPTRDKRERLKSRSHKGPRQSGPTF